ncbi:hypothetical protein H6801_00230 [Candidatus Nomurabacteria bacterium]|jgi:hypothetical protein|nr:hypothetical protein [Candidatus Saccharibacteria bacterium]MCB9821788.1 hypothetical protein [Candidatus Nomurabacteria bacterium]
MYSGTTLHGKSGNLIGAHQKFDRVARRFVHKLRPEIDFPTTKQILHFEGNNGPDGIKRKSPGVDEPWHYWDPTDKNDTHLQKIITAHLEALTQQIIFKNPERVAFEAAWLAHAIVDGLTPAHHYPYEEKLLELRGEGLETRTSIKDKIVIKGDTKRQTLSNNWKMWGAKGLMLSHASFEWGVSTVAMPLLMKRAMPNEAQIKHAKNVGFNTYLNEHALDILELNMYERFLRYGWTLKLSRQVKNVLCPKIVNSIAVAWIIAIDEAR